MSKVFKIIFIIVMGLVFTGCKSSWLALQKEVGLSSVVYSEYELVWSDEFSGTELDLSNWQYMLGDGSDYGIPGWGNNELEIYTNKNTQVKDGLLIIEARKSAEGGYTSARLTSRDLREFKYGRIEARIKAPYGQGTWPAFWMMGTEFNWPYCGEIDIFEMMGSDGDVSSSGRRMRGNAVAGGALHFANEFLPEGENVHEHNSEPMWKRVEGKLADKFHLIGIEWDEQSIKWFLDGEVFGEQDISQKKHSEFHQPAYLLLNLAIRGGEDRAPNEKTKFPQKFIIDYVRVYQKKAL